MSAPLIFWIFIVLLLQAFGWNRRKAILSTDGFFSAALLGGILLFLDAAPVVLLLIYFLGSSMLLRRWWPQEGGPPAPMAYREGKPRNALQVWCNGGLSALMILLARGIPPHNDRFSLLAVCSIAIATADTWASEIGTAYRKPVLNLRTLRIDAAGVSGGMSLPGTFAAALGALSVAFLSLLLLPNITLQQAAIIALTGFAGMGLDSILGAWFQAQYRNAQGQWSDMPLPGFERVQGWRFLGNNGVNLLSASLTLALLAACIA